MKTLLSVSLLLASVSAFSAPKTQVIRCFESGDVIQLSMSVDAYKVKSAVVEYAGDSLAPDLYRGQAHGSDQPVVQVLRSRAVALSGFGTDPSSDNPYVFQVEVAGKFIGKNWKTGGAVSIKHFPNAGKYDYASAEAFIKDLTKIMKDRYVRPVELTFTKCDSRLK